MHHPKKRLPHGYRAPGDVPISHVRQVVEDQFVCGAFESFTCHPSGIFQEFVVSFQDCLDRSNTIKAFQSIIFLLIGRCAKKSCDADLK